MCELQGYVYDAKVRLAEVFEVLCEPDRAETLREQANDLQRRFDETFWMEDEGFIAYGLDSEKRQIKTIASNAGHCLWSGIVRPDKAERVVRRFMQEDVLTGWGIRTLRSLRQTTFTNWCWVAVLVKSCNSTQGGSHEA